MRVVETVVVIAFFLIYISIGLYYRRFATASRSDYFTASGNIGLSINTLATFAAFASGGSFLGSIGVAYAVSISYIWSAIIGSVTGFVVASILVAPYLKTMKLNGIIDFFKERYNDWKPLRILGGLIIIFAFTLYLVSQYKAAGITSEYLLGWNYEWTLIIVTLIFIFYTAVGGMWAVSMIEALQAIIMFSLMVALPVVAMWYLGGPVTMIARAIELKPDWSILAAPVVSLIGFALIWTFTVSCFPHITMRILSARSSKEAGKAMGLTGLMYGLFCLIGFLGVSAAAINLFPPGSAQALKDPDFAYIAVMTQYFPKFLQGLAAAAIFAAVMSTTSGLLLAIAAAVGNDVWPTLFPNTRERTLITISQITIVVAGIISALLALNPPELLVILYSQATAVMTAGFFGPLMLGIWWKKVTKYGALANMIVGSGTCLAIFLLDSSGVISTPTFLEFVIALPLGIIANVLVSHVTYQPDSQEIKVGIEKMTQVHQEAKNFI